MEPARLEPGVTLSGHLLSEEIGAGGYARVFRAERADGTSVALKVAVRPELVAALRSEGQVLRRLEGPRFVKILEEHLDADPPFFVLEYCAGGDLRALLEKQPGKRLAPERALEIFAKVCEGIAFAHDEGLVHGDLKPENILIDAAGEPKIADLGLSRAHRRKLIEQQSRLAASQSTDAGKVRGTFDYLAPEVRKGGEISPESDVFALGVLLYEMVTGARPLGLFQLPGELLGREGIATPPALDRVATRALAHAASDRHADAGILLADLRAGEKGLVPTAERESAPARSVNPLLLRTLEEGFLDGIAQVLIVGAWLTILALWLTSLVLVISNHAHVSDFFAPAAIVLAIGTGATGAIAGISYGSHRVRRSVFIWQTERALKEDRR